MKKYPLVLENCGGDVYLLISRGHQDIKEFGREVLKNYSHFMLMSKPEHYWLKAVPPPDGYSTWYVPVEKGVRGAFPATFCQETFYNDEEPLKFWTKLGFKPKQRSAV